MNKKQREKHKFQVKKFMEKKREFNKNNPEEYEAKKLIHKKTREKKLVKKDEKRLKKILKEKKRRIKKAYKDGKIDKIEFNIKMKELKSKP